MTRDAESIFHAARTRPEPERKIYLDGACGNDVALRAKVEMLLNADAEAGSFMKSIEPPAKNGATIEDPRGERAGEQIGRYKLLQQIGEGGFGSVWMAEQREPVKRRVALKIIKLGMDTRQVIARFEAERQALAMMDHPNIAKVLDAGSTETGRPFFVMELVKGVPILEYCDNEKLDTKARLDLFIKVCQAIQHAHQKGIIHRDIKPSNVLITLHDGVPVPKVIDFGIAKATNQELTDKTLFTQHRQMIGTPAYMSPEQAEMSGLDVDTRSDIYSLGVLLYELLTGTTPFATDELMSKGFAEMMRIIREVEPHKPSTRLSTLGETASRTAEQRHAPDPKKLGTILRGDLDWIVMKCLEKDRSRRYETANGLAADILHHLNDEPVVAGPPSTSYKLRKFVKRNRSHVMGASALAAVLVLGIAGTTWGMLWALNERARVSAQTAVASQAIREANKLVVATFDELAREYGDATARALPGGDSSEFGGMEVDALAMASNNLAVLLSQSLKDEAATRHAAERELVRTSEIKRLITEMFQSVDPAKAQGADITLLRGILDETAGRLNDGEVQDELIAAELHAIIGHVYRKLGLYPDAERHLPVALEIETRVRGEEHPSTLGMMMKLAILYREQGRYAEAEQLYIKTQTIQKRVLGEEHPDTLTSMSNLAILHWNQARYPEAEALYLETLEIRKRVLGEEHPETLASMNNLANLYEDLGQYAKAEPLYLETLQIRKRVLGEEHPSTLASMNNLAIFYDHQNRYAEAEALYLETLKIRKRVLGAEHPDTLTTMNNLATLYSVQGHYDEAELLRLETLQIVRRVLGEEHPNTLGTIMNLAAQYNELNRYEDAAAMYETCVPTLRRVLGTEHPWTGYAVEGLAEAYAGLGRQVDALQLWRELLGLQIDSADSADADANTLNAAAWTLLTHDLEELRDPAQALGYAERACALEEATGGANLWTYLDTLALAQHLTDDTAAAVETQKRAISLMPSPDADPKMHDRLAQYEAALSVKPDGNGDDK